MFCDVRREWGWERWWFQEFKQEIGDNASKSADLYEVSKALF